MNLKSDEKSIQYEVYAPGQNQKLDLSVCSKTKVEILYPIQLDEETQKIYDNLKSQGYDLFDKNNKFYKDICTPYKSADGTDIILADRNNDFFAKHEIICQANCDYSSFSSDSSFVKCDCDVVEKEKIEAEEPKRVTSKGDVDSFVDILKFSNYKVLYCYNLVFRGETFSKNLGSIFTLLYFIGYCICFGFFCYQGLKQFKLEVSRLFRRKHDIRNIKVNDIIKTNININENKNQNKEKKVNIIANSKLKELMDKDTNKINKNDNLNKNKKDNNVMSIFKEKEPVDSSVNLINSNSKSNLQNKQTNLIGVNDKTAKVKDNMKITENITNTYGNIRKNIDIKNNKEPTSKTKITKGEFPPKRNSNNNANSMNIMDSNIIIHQNKNSRKDFGENEKKSFTKEEFLNKEEEQKGTNQIIDEKQAVKDKIIQKKKVILSDYELNHLDYIDALSLDNRIFLRIYWSLLKREHPIIYTFMAWNDYNLFFVKLSKFFFLITTVMALDALFFSNDAMHDIYVTGGSYGFGNHFTQMVLTIIIYEPLQILLNYLTFTDIDYYKIKARKDTITQKEVVGIINCIKYRLIGYYAFTFLLFLFYWYLNSAFCAVYENTQGYFIADSFLCFIFALIYPLILYLAPTGLRKISFICRKANNLKIVYKISQFIPVF